MFPEIESRCSCELSGYTSKHKETDEHEKIEKGGERERERERKEKL